MTDNVGMRPLHYACMFGAPLEVVRYLVHEYPESLQVPDNDGLPLHHACSRYAPLDVVLYLVQEFPESLQVRPQQQKETH
jgi:ankyrin repeat protein